MVERIYKSSRGEVHYWKSKHSEAGQETLVLLHGLTADHRLFDLQVSYFEEAYQLIVWDAPAHGKSRPYAPFTYPNAAEDLNGIFDENGIETAVLIGQSMGGYLAQSFLLRYPKRVSAFISIDSTPYGDYYSKSDQWWIRQIEWMAKCYPLRLLKKGIAKQCTATEHAYNNMLAMLGHYGKDELCRLMGFAYSSFLDDNRPLEICCPALLLVGERDRTGKVQAYNRAWTNKTGLPLHIIPDAAHNANDDNPEAVNREIELFLKEIG